MRYIAILVLLLAIGGDAKAELVTPDGTWASLSGISVTDTRPRRLSNPNDTVYNAYWNSNSADSASQCLNVGCFVTGQGGFAGDPRSPQVSDAVWLTTQSGAMPTFAIQGNLSGPVSLVIELASMRDGNWFGWYDPVAASLAGFEFTLANRGTAWDVIFDGYDSPDTNPNDSRIVNSTTVSPSSTFGFWFAPNLGRDHQEEVFATNPSNASLATRDLLLGRLNSTNTGGMYGANNYGTTFSERERNFNYSTSRNYFSLFADSLSAVQSGNARFWLGVEDLRHGDNDYNDMIVSFSLVSGVVAAPEPGFYGVLALGLSALFFGLRRNKR